MTAIPNAAQFLSTASAATRHVSDGFAAFDLGAARMDFHRDAEIYGEGEAAEFVYQVVSGAVRTCKLLEDGRRQIGAFHLPGDVFGLEASGEHHFSAEAVIDSKIALVRRSTLLTMAGRDADLARTLFEVAARDLARAQEHMLLLGRKTAAEKVATFLVELAGRNGGTTVDLPMSRTDIADYLGLTIETVSRTLSLLESRRAIELAATRRIVLRNPAALRALNA